MIQLFFNYYFFFLIKVVYTYLSFLFPLISRFSIFPPFSIPVFVRPYWLPLSNDSQIFLYYGLLINGLKVSIVLVRHLRLFSSNFLICVHVASAKSKLMMNYHLKCLSLSYSLRLCSSDRDSFTFKFEKSLKYSNFCLKVVMHSFGETKKYDSNLSESYWKERLLMPDE